MPSCISTFLHPPVLQDLTWILEGFVRIPREGRLSSSLFMIYLMYLTLCSGLFVFMLRICTPVWEMTLSAVQNGIGISYLDLRMPLHAQTDHSLSTFWSGNPFMPLLFIQNRWLYSLEQLIKSKTTSWVTFFSHFCKHRVKVSRLIVQSTRQKVPHKTSYDWKHALRSLDNVGSRQVKPVLSPPRLDICHYTPFTLFHYDDIQHMQVQALHFTRHINKAGLQIYGLSFGQRPHVLSSKKVP